MQKKSHGTDTAQRGNNVDENQQASPVRRIATAWASTRTTFWGVFFYARLFDIQQRIDSSLKLIFDSENVSSDQAYNNDFEIHLARGEEPIQRQTNVRA